VVASQVVLAFNSVIRLGKDRAEFDKAVTQMYGTALDPALAEDLFAAYVDCSKTSPSYVSKTKKTGKTRCRKGAKKNDQAEDDPVSEGETDPDVAEPHWVTLPGGRYRAADGRHLVTTRSTFINVDDAQSSCPSGKTWPRQQRGAAKLPTPVSEAAEDEDQMPPQWASNHECNKCHAHDPDGWKSKDGLFWCVGCWERFKSKTDMLAGYSPTPPAGPYPGGPSIRFDTMDRLPARAGFGSSSGPQTEIRVVRSCSLAAAQAAGGRAMLLVHGREHGPLSEHQFGQGGSVIRTSTLQQAVRATSGFDRAPVPRWGGIYTPEVLVTADGEGRPLDKPFRVAMLYAAATRAVSSVDGADGDEAAMDKFCAEMREKVLNILRIGHNQNHDELVLGAWGCGWRGGPRPPRREVAAIFRAALLGDSDVAGLFRRVTFAINSEDDFRAFQEEFAPFCGPSNGAADGAVATAASA